MAKCIPPHRESHAGYSHGEGLLKSLLHKRGVTLIIPNRPHLSIVHFGKDDTGFSVSGIDLNVEAEVEGMDEAEFNVIAGKVKSTCPISKAIAAPITLSAKLVNAAAAS